MPRKGKKWIDPKNATKFRLVHRSYDDPRYGDSESAVRILAPVENPNIARKRLPDEHYEQKEKLIELVESYNQATIEAAEAKDGADAQHDQPPERRPRASSVEDYDDDISDDDDHYRGEDEDGEGEEHDEDDDDARFADADEDDDDLPPLEEDERKQKAPAQKSSAPKDVKGKAKGSRPAGMSGEEFELGEYGFEHDYDYAQHFKPMGTAGAVFMEAPTKGNSKKGQQKQAAFALREDVEKQKSAKVVTTEVVDFLDDADVPEEIPQDLLAALNDPEAFESLTDDFVVAAEDGEVVAGEQDESRQGKRGNRKVYFEEEDEDDEGGEYEEGEYDEDEEDDEDLEALLQGLKANPDGNKRRERNEYEQVFDARFEKALAEFDDDEIGELDMESEQIKGALTVDQLKPMLKEFISSRRRVKGIIGKPATGTADGHDDEKKSQSGDVKGHESEGEREDAGEDEESDGELVLVEAEEPRDQWDCESITTTYTNTENHPTLIDDDPLRSRRLPPIVLSKKTGIPLGVLPTKPAKAKQDEEEASVNQGQARSKTESKEEKRARKQQIKEARKANRERKKELKGAFKEEEIRQLSMQAKGQGQRIIRLK